MNKNPIDITIPANSFGSINCVSNAGYVQKVTLTWEKGSVTFTGTGESQPMTTQDGALYYSLPACANEYTISALFQYAVTPIAPFNNANVRSPIITNDSPFLITEVTSEDSTDNDNNDSYLSIILMVSPESLDVNPIQLADFAEGANALELHAKTYYNDPDYLGGDEHYVTINKPSEMGTKTNIPVKYSGTSWTMAEGKCYYEPTALGGYLTVGIVLNNNTHSGFKNARLVLNTAIPFWGPFPTGSVTADWTAILYYCNYIVTRVTP